MSITLPIHPTTGLQALGYTSRGPIWPIFGGSGEGSGDGGTGEGGVGSTETGSGGNGDGDSAAETVESLQTKLTKYQEIAKTQEKRAKENAAAAKRLAELEDAQKSEAEKAADKVKAAEAEVAQVPAKVAEVLKQHLVKLHGDQIDQEKADLFLTATDPELLLKQVEGLLGDTGKSKKNYVAREGTNTTGKADDDRAFVREFFGSSS